MYARRTASLSGRYFDDEFFAGRHIKEPLTLLMEEHGRVRLGVHALCQPTFQNAWREKNQRDKLGDGSEFSERPLTFPLD